jgi:cell division septation protein DedD
LAQDDYYYEIQLTNKQLVFYFMAGATGLILSFLAGVMVGRGVDSVAGEVQAARTVQEDRIVAEETPRPVKPAAEDLTYAQRLEGDRVDDTLERPKPAGAPPKPFSKLPPSPRPAGASQPKPTAAPPARVAANTPAPAPAAPAAAAPAAADAATFTIQVGAFKERARADAIVSRLKGKGFAPTVSGGPDGPFTVRVGNYPDRPAAERDVARLRDEEKLAPFIVKR